MPLPPRDGRHLARFPSYSSAYELIDRLEAFNCAYSTFRSIGPQSYNEIRSAIDVGEGQEGDVTEDGKPARCNIPNWMRKERDILMGGQPFAVSGTGLAIQNDSLALKGIDSTLPSATFPLRGGRPTFNGETSTSRASPPRAAAATTWASRSVSPPPRAGPAELLESRRPLLHL